VLDDEKRAVVQDIDCHVILRAGLTEGERVAAVELHDDLAARYPPMGGELDAYFILLDAARGTPPPQHQLNLEVFDNSWALHCAHVRAGIYLALWGPEPTEIFPAPSWSDVSAALEVELNYVKEHLQYPAYCILNLCRILFSYAESDPAISKHSSGLWASERFPEWEPIIAAAIKFYSRESSSEDESLMSHRLDDFLVFAVERINAYRPAAPA
jgi:hypothetical protein